jgi:hypothetical protein
MSSFPRTHRRVAIPYRFTAWDFRFSRRRYEYDSIFCCCVVYFFGSLFYDAFSVSIVYSDDDRVTSEWWWTDEDKHPYLKRNSNPRSQRPSDQDLRLRPRGHGHVAPCSLIPTFRMCGPKHCTGILGECGPVAVEADKESRLLRLPCLCRGD